MNSQASANQENKPHHEHKSNNAPKSQHEHKTEHHHHHHGHKPIWQCDAKVHRTMMAVKDHLHQLCADHVHRLVKVETCDGDVFEGHIVSCHRGVLFICLSNEGCDRAFFPGGPPVYYNNVLPLVLFNLLAISLL
ncbi:hypothetical protein A8990_116119 [Paenibacillus taihuensis]|uniref:Uncharacterized protein n=1 Tax=Paenibacillus taihuensis TaxID=1156355 RepID=A0A3D9RVC6_9BACL|nr:hypothetical protein [Paenibacillus taihuensis]REE83940.1 hypothetical protein A8990_116119 [Paenibacillus taihuensis]